MKRLCSLLLLGFLSQAPAAVLPPGYFEYLVVDNLPNPTTMTFAPDGRLFVGQQTGQLRVVENGKLVPQPVVALDVDSLGEHGLLGIAFDDNFANDHFIYIYYTAKKPYIHDRLSRFVLDGDVASNEVALFDFDDMGYSIYHNGATIAFGPDGKIYVGPGENGGYPFLENAQNLTNLFGKVVRLNRDGSIPTDNPFYNTLTGNERAIYAYGFRNPYTINFEPGTGRLFVDDVGGEKFEEIDVVEPGKNFGWPRAEGVAHLAPFIDPLFSYAHGPATSLTEGCAITGGAFYHPDFTNFEAKYRDQYFFTDFCNGWIRVLDPNNGEVTDFGSQIASNPTDLRVGPDGDLYYTSRWMEGIYKIEYNGHGGSAQ